MRVSKGFEKFCGEDEMLLLDGRSFGLKQAATGF